MHIWEKRKREKEKYFLLILYFLWYLEVVKLGSEAQYFLLTVPDAVKGFIKSFYKHLFDVPYILLGTGVIGMNKIPTVSEFTF